jgi:hypothetical protein
MPGRVVSGETPAIYNPAALPSTLHSTQMARSFIVL